MHSRNKVADVGFEFLVRGYSDRFYYWELVNMGRKIFLVGLLLFFWRGTVIIPCYVPLRLFCIDKPSCAPGLTSPHRSIFPSNEHTHEHIHNSENDASLHLRRISTNCDNYATQLIYLVTFMHAKVCCHAHTYHRCLSRMLTQHI